MHTDYFDYVRGLFDRSKIDGKPEALKGIRVLDFTHMIFGPTVAKTLALFGAEVIKVEVPYIGDYWRTSTYWGKYWKHSNPFYHFINPNKYFVGIDVKYPEGKELILKLAEMSDVVIENFAAGTAEAWGIGYTQISKINPKIIYASCSTFGQFGPDKFRPGWDMLAQGVSGAIGVTGYPDTDLRFKIPDYYGDFQPGNYAAMFVLAALRYRQKTGKGQYLDIAQGEILMREMFHFTYMSATGKSIGATGNNDPTMAPSGIFKTQDKTFLALAVSNDMQFKALCKAMQRLDLAQDPRYEKAPERLKAQNADLLNKLVSNWIACNKANEILDLAKIHGFAATRVMNDVDLCNDEWRRERGSVVEFDDEMYKKLVLPAAPVQLSETPGRLKWLSRPLGYHNRYVFKKLLKLSDDEIKMLQDKRVVGNWDYHVGQRPPVYYDIQQDKMFNYKEETNGQ